MKILIGSEILFQKAVKWMENNKFNDMNFELINQFITFFEM